MQPTTGATQPQTMPFTEQHNAIYNGLRDTMLKYAAAGVPGMDKVADILNKQHTLNMQNYTPQQKPVAQPVSSQPATPQNALGTLNGVMQQIRQQNAPSLPNGTQGYSA